VLQEGFIPLVRQYAKSGVPPCLRPTLWRVICGLEEVITDNEKDYYAELQHEVRRRRRGTRRLAG